MPGRIVERDLKTRLGGIVESFFENLTPNEREIFTATTVVENLLSDVQNAETQHKSKSTSRKVSAALKPFIAGVEQYAAAFDVIANCSTSILSPLWGSFRIVLHLAKEYSEYFDKVADMMEIMGLHLSQLRRLPQLFPDNDQLKLFMVEICQLMFEFCSKARSVFVQASEREGKNHLRAITPVGLSTMIKLIWKPFKIQFGDIRTKLGECMTKIDSEINLAEKEEAHAERLRAAQDRIVQGSRWEKTEEFHNKWHNEMEENEMGKVTKWLAPADVVSNHSASAKLRHGTTGSWFLDGEAFQTWLDADEQPLFWLHAIPGAGKTVLASSVINYLRRGFQSNQTGLAYFYCDYRETGKQEPAAVLRTLLNQLSGQNPAVFQSVQNFFKEQYKDDRAASLVPPSLDLIRSNFSSLLDTSFDKVYIVIDALDECNDRECILKAILAIADSLENVKIFVTSREDPLINEEFGGFPNLTMRAKHVSGDIEEYVDARLKERIAAKKLKVKDDDLRNHISDTLVLKAEGMFQWINCQIDHLCKFKTHNAIREALKSLPKTLEETYLRILLAIDEDYSETVQKLLKWLVRGTREMTMEELAIAIAIDSHAENEYFDPGDQMDPEDIVASCSSLLLVSDDNKVSLAHFTVKEFLTSPRIKEKLGMYFIGEEDVHSELAEVCLTYLGYRDFDRSPLTSVEELTSFLDKFGFLEYASKSWSFHAHHASSRENLIHSLVENLFHSDTKNRFNYALWLQIYYMQRRGGVINIIEPTHVTPIYYASLFGLPQIVTSLLDEGAEFMIGDGRKDDPIYASSAEGHAEVIEILLKRCFEGDSKEKLGRYLYPAASKGHAEAVEVLFTWGAPIESSGGKYGTALQVSALEGRVDVVSVLLKRGANFKAVDTRFGTPLAAAAEKGHRNVVQTLLAAGAPINGRGGWYSTPLISAIVGKDESIINMMLDNGANVNLQGGRHDCALMAAAALGKIELVQKLIDLGAKVNDENDKGADALYSATCAGRLDVVELLLASGADVNAKGGKHRNALNAASAEGHLEIVQTLLAAGADAQANDYSYGNCLQAAAYHGHKDIVRVLAAAGVDVNDEGGIRRTALVNAVECGETEMIDLLVELSVQTGNTRGVLDALVVATAKEDEILIKHVLALGAEIDDLGTIGWGFQDWTALAMAASKGNQALVEMFLGLGADVNADAGSHHTALIAAIDTHWYNHNVLETLLAAGANVNDMFDEGDEKYAGSALVAAVRRADVRAITLLLDNGADPNLLNGCLRTPLMEAVNNRDEAVVDLLIERGTDVNLTVDPSEDIADFDTDNGMSTALETAAGEGYIALIHRLVQAGALLEQPRDDTAFKSALQCAAYYEEDEAVTALLELGSDVNVVGGVWGSVLQAAVCSGSDTVVKLILDAGANINEHHVGKHGSALIASCVENDREEGSDAFTILIDRGVDPNVDAGGELPYAIIAMASTNDDKGVQALIKSGADVNKYGGKYHSAIQASAIGGSVEITEMLLNAGAEVNAYGGIYGTALECAYQNGYYLVIWKLYEWGALHTIDGGMWGSALGAAISGSCHTLVQQLVRRHEVNVNQSCGKWGSALHFLIYQRSNDEEELLNVFLDAGADINALGGCYSTPLGAAVVEGEDGVFERLLEQGADPNLVDEKSGRSPLFLACQEQKFSYVKQLIDKGADVNVCTKRGSVLQSATFNSDGEKKSLKIIQKIISSGADINAVTKGPYGTALHAAAMGNSKTIKWLLEHGADVKLMGGHFGSVLQAAAANGPLAVSRLLLKHGADINQIGGRYRTALQAACAAGDPFTAKLLLDNGADPNIKGGKYGTALQAACVARDTALVRLLLARGADPKISGGRYENAFTAAMMMGDNEVVKVLLAEEGVSKAMLGKRKGHYKDYMWEGCEEFIEEVLADEEPLEPFDETEIELPDEDENEDDESGKEDETGEDDDDDEDWESEEEETEESDVEIDGVIFL